MDKYCNGGDLPGVIRNGDVIYFVSYKWYENLKEDHDEELLNNKEVSDVENKNLVEENEVAEIFRIETDIFDFETPLYYGPWMEPKDDTKHSCKPFRLKNRLTKWPTCNWKMDKYCNGGDLPGVIWNGDVIYFGSYEWYENLEEGELKDEA
nr:hypothetical protein [Tanacetum cinerariifolium]